MGLFDFLKRKKNLVDHTGVVPDNLVIPKPHVMDIKVAGVTFENRQELLQKINDKKPPFNKVLNFEFIGVSFEGELAIEVRVNGYLIGYVKKTRIAEFVKHKDYGYKITKYFVTTLYDDDNKPYGHGMTIKVIFNK